MFGTSHGDALNCTTLYAANCVVIYYALSTLERIPVTLHYLAYLKWDFRVLLICQLGNVERSYVINENSDGNWYSNLRLQCDAFKYFISVRSTRYSFQCDHILSFAHEKSYHFLKRRSTIPLPGKSVICLKICRACVRINVSRCLYNWSNAYPTTLGATFLKYRAHKELWECKATSMIKDSLSAISGCGDTGIWVFPPPHPPPVCD